MRLAGISSLTAALLLLVAAPALAGGAGLYSGTVDQSPPHSLKFRVRHGKVRKVTFSARYSCANASDDGVYKRTFTGSAPVGSDGRFTFDVETTSLEEVRFRGRIRHVHHRYKAKGRIAAQIRSQEAGEEPDCSTTGGDANGFVRWHAKRTS